MKDVVKHYTNGEITVVWKPDLCFHSSICWKGLGEVFNPHKKPWIVLGDIDSQRIVDQVNQCPSHALSYFRNSEKANGNTANSETDKVSSPGSSSEVSVDTIIEALPNGPLMVYGNITVKDKTGKEHHRHEVTALCRCGSSSNKPFCDGSHARVGFKDE